MKYMTLSKQKLIPTLLSVMDTPIYIPKATYSHGLTRKVGKFLRFISPEALTFVKCIKITVCNSCEYDDDLRPKINEDTYFTLE